MDVKIHVTDRQGKEQIISGPTEMSLNLMELLKVHEYPVEGTCGGMALCASCHIFIHSTNLLPEISSSEQAMLDDNWDSKDNSRLACQIPISENVDLLKIELAPEDL
jgi:2Fe-2S ferredoxin